MIKRVGLVHTHKVYFFACCMLHVHVMSHAKCNMQKNAQAQATCTCNVKKSYMCRHVTCNMHIQLNMQKKLDVDLYMLPTHATFFASCLCMLHYFFFLEYFEVVYISCIQNIFKKSMCASNIFYFLSLFVLDLYKIIYKIYVFGITCLEFGRFRFAFPIALACRKRARIWFRSTYKLRSVPQTCLDSVCVPHTNRILLLLCLSLSVLRFIQI